MSRRQVEQVVRRQRKRGPLDAARESLVFGPKLTRCFDIPFRPMQRRHGAVAADLAAAVGTVVAASAAAVEPELSSGRRGPGFEDGTSAPWRDSCT